MLWPMRETHLSFVVDGERLHGMLYLPALTPAGRHPAVLLLHGFTGQRGESHRLFVLMARRLAAQGIAAYRFDFRGAGESEGSYADMTVTRQLAEVAAAQALLQAHPELDPRRLGLLGLSMGGMVAALSVGLGWPALALWAPAHPQGWLAKFGPKPGREQVAAALASGHGVAFDDLPPGITFDAGAGVFDFAGHPVGFEFFIDLTAHEPLDGVRAHTGPALVVHGSADPVVPLAIGERYAQAINAPLVVIDAALHTFERLTWQEQVIATTCDFFATALQA
jgi:uncharacterized protein